LNYRQVTFARDLSDYFVLPTPTPVTTAQPTPVLRRTNHFAFNLAFGEASLALTFTVGNTTAPSNPSVALTFYSATGAVIKTATLPSDSVSHTKVTTVTLANIAAGNYEFDLVPQDPSLTYSFKADANTTIALKNGADLADGGTPLYFYVPAEVETAFLAAHFDSTPPVQF